MAVYVPPEDAWEALPSLDTPITTGWLTQVDTALATVAGRGVVDLRDFGAAGTGSDDLGVFEDAIAEAPEGSTIWVPPGVYKLSDTLVVDRHVSLAGTWTRDKNDSNGNQVYGTIIEPTDDTAQAGMTDGMIHIQRSWVQVSGLFLQGGGPAEGGTGLRFSGTDPGSGGRHSHGASAHRVGVGGFGTGTVFGDWSDHVSLHGCALNDNNDGVSFEADNHFDHYVEDCLLDGNVRSSVFMPDGVGTDNFVIIRSHLGFSQYGIYQDDTSNSGNGFSGLTMLGCPVEFVSAQHMVLGTTGLVYVRGGYWGWDGTPANPCVTIKAVTHGPCWFSPRLDSGLANPNATAFVHVEDYNNHPIFVETPTADFVGDHPQISGSYSVQAGVPFTATLTPETDYSLNQVMELSDDTVVSAPIGRTDSTLKFAFFATGGTQTVTFDAAIRETNGNLRGPHSVPNGEVLMAELDYLPGTDDWGLTRILISDA